MDGEENIRRSVLSECHFEIDERESNEYEHDGVHHEEVHYARKRDYGKKTLVHLHLQPAHMPCSMSYLACK